MARTYSTIPELTEKEITRFWTKVAPVNDNGCRLWTAGAAGPRPDALYGKFGITRNGKTQSYTATRIAYFLYSGEQFESLLICHRCDVPLCVAQEHLFLGTYTENMRDAWDKGRMAALGNPWVTHSENMPRGERHGRSKITEQMVREIRHRAANGEVQRVIAQDFGISQSMVSMIYKRQNWTHLD